MTDMIVYHIQRKDKGVEVSVREPGEHGDEVYPLIDVKDNGGFNYGYYGSGPINLAFSMLAHFLGESNLEKWEWYSMPFLSGILDIDFAKHSIAVLDQEKKEHYIYAAEIRGFFKFHHSKIDIDTYKERRDQYRKDLREHHALEIALESGNHDDESQESAAKRERWKALWERIISFEDWVHGLRRVA